MKKGMKVFVIILVAIVLLLVIGLCALSVWIYESNFGSRYEPYAPLSHEIEEFPGLEVQRYSFPSNKGQLLAGFRYYRRAERYKGVVVIGHGLGVGGHKPYMDVADYFTRQGYQVFAYDVTGNDASEGKSIYGVPQGIIDMERAISFMQGLPELASLPIMIFGHSWGAYSAANVLNVHPQVQAIVMVAGIDSSFRLIQETGRQLAGDVIEVLMPFISMYERLKFGKYSSFTATDGIAASDCGVMIIHSKDDQVIAWEDGYQYFFDQYHDDPRFSFVLFEDRGHDHVYYADAAREYRLQFNNEFEAYLKQHEIAFTPEFKVSYLTANLDKKALYEFDEQLMNSVVDWFDAWL